MTDYEPNLREAVKRFWSIRGRQSTEQGTKTGIKDHGNRSAVTGGAQMDGFVDLVASFICTNGIAQSDVFRNKGVELPGFFRPEKKWDIVFVTSGKLVAAIEFKSHIGPSFGNNFNNRTEEAVGSATDYRTAYREGAFSPSANPWLGYLMLLEDCPRSRSVVKSREPHFSVLREFKDSSYLKRYEILLLKLIRERLYDGTCLICADRNEAVAGRYLTPHIELSFEFFMESLLAKIIATARAGL